MGASALALIVFAIPMIRRRVRPNRFYGFRTPATLRNERLWYEVNARTGVDLFWIGVGLLGITLAHAFGVVAQGLFVAISLGWLTVGALWSVAHGFAIIGRNRS